MDPLILLNKLIQKKDLTTKEANLFLTTMMSGEVTPSQIGALLTALRMKGETIDEIIGLVQAMREHMIQVKVQSAIDVCGTGGDGTNTFNISTAVALVVAGAGVKVAKHGNRAASSASGSADVLEALGVHIQLTPQQAENVLQKTGMVFLFAPLYHPATKHVALVRKELKIRTIFNVLGPLANPASVKRQLIGVPDKAMAKKLAAVAGELDYQHALIVASRDGLDEISTFSQTKVYEIKGKTIKEFTVNPKEYGFKYYPFRQIQGGTPQENAEIIRQILDGTKGAKRDIVVLNSAFALYAADVIRKIPEGIKLAEESIDSGSAKRVLESLIKETKQYK